MAKKSRLFTAIFLLSCIGCRAQTLELLTEAYDLRSDSLMQLFLGTCKPKASPNATTFARDEDFLHALLIEAAAQGGILPKTDPNAGKALPASIPIYYVLEFRGHPRVNAGPDLELDIRFLDGEGLGHFYWIDRAVDSIICRFLEQELTYTVQGAKVTPTSDRFQFLSKYIGLHLDGGPLVDPMALERNMITIRRPYCGHLWNYASEPFVTAIYTDNRRKAWIVVNQLERKHYHTYRKGIGGWKLIH